MSSNDTIGKTLVVAFSLCLVCSVIVSTAAVVLKPKQEINKDIDKIPKSATPIVSTIRL